MPGLKVATYNTYRERKGRDPALDDLLKEDALICLQEVSISRARELKRRFGPRVYLSWVTHGWQWLAIILPKDAQFTSRSTRNLNSYFGLIPRIWSLLRTQTLYPGRRHGWSDGLSPRAVQVTEVLLQGRTFRAMNTHLPYEFGLRDRCLSLLSGLVGEGPVLLAGDLNATPEDLFLRDFLLATGLQAAGDRRPTHNSKRRIDYVLHRDGFGCSFREVEYTTKKGRSDHRRVIVGLEVD
ncbi:MAG: endonuclease/exonuclease/phosphatase family protein [Rubrobacteraceae bacterium]